MLVVRVKENVRAVQSSYYSSCPWLHMTFDMRDSTSYADPGLKMRDTFALATVFDSEVGPAAPLSGF
jgi:hypothetical protein